METNEITEEEAAEAAESRRQVAQEFVDLTHMVDWIYNERRQRLAEWLELENYWRTHAAYLECRVIAGLDVDRSL